MDQLSHTTRGVQKDFLPLNGTDYIEFYVGNAKQAAYYYRSAFGMKLVAYSGPETKTRDRASYVLQQDKIRFVLTTPLRSEHPITTHLLIHGDGVHDIALWVEDAESAYRETTRRGGRGVLEPLVLKDEKGEVKILWKGKTIEVSSCLGMLAWRNPISFRILSA